MPDAPDRQPVIVHLIDGTYELFRHFYGSMRGRQAEGSAVRAPSAACWARCWA